LDAGAVLASLSGQIAKFKQPKGAVVLADLPRNAMGKVLKAELKGK
jgi:acyl-coenzyme A synthetase/AMP-(fatty) acid ligase